MINKRLVVAQGGEGFHFSKWDKHEFKKYFKDVIFHSFRDDPEGKIIKKDDVLFVYATLARYQDVECFAKFGILYPGFGFHPLKNPSQTKNVAPLFDKYTGIFMNEGPVWETYKHLSTGHLVPLSCDPTIFKKTRKRDTFKKIIQVAGLTGPYKGREISEQVMNLLPYEGELIPPMTGPMYIPWEELPAKYQSADGFLNPNMIGEGPGYPIDAKYTQSTIEAGMSGCIIFWHDCMDLGNSFETVFKISLNPVEIAKKIKDVVDNIDLEKHSQLTAEEFYDKCNMIYAMKYKVDIMKRFL
jgi:hypothetical protein